MDNFDNILTNAIKNDRLTTKPSELVHDYLSNQMLKTATASKTRHNGFTLPFRSKFGTNNLAWKISVAAVLLISFMGIKQINHNTIYVQTADSTQVNQSIDTVSFHLVDSCFNN